MVEALPSSVAGIVLGKQLLRSATSVGANYRAACPARSTADLIAKLGIVEEECDECVFWMDLIAGSALVKEFRIAPLKNQAEQILSMVVSSIKTARISKKKTRP